MSAAKHWCFTLNNPTPAQKMFLTMYDSENFREDYDVKYVIYQVEQGENGTPHIQGYIQFVRKKRMTTVKASISPQAHVEIARGTAEQNRDYCTKEEGRLEGPFEYGEFTPGQGTRNDVADFVRRVCTRIPSESELLTEYSSIVAKYPRFVSRVINFYSTPRPVPFVPRPGWQVDLSILLHGEPDERRVYWYHEPIGNYGKSYFARNFVDGFGTRGYLITGGRHGDIYFAYKKERIVFFDWARDNADSFPYSVVENFKNGYFLNTKYESQPCRFQTPHVVVFANFPPDRSKLSNDRWQIKDISQ